MQKREGWERREASLAVYCRALLRQFLLHIAGAGARTRAGGQFKAVATAAAVCVSGVFVRCLSFGRTGGQEEMCLFTLLWSAR